MVVATEEKRFLLHFPPECQGAVGHLFYKACRRAREEWGERARQEVGKICSALFRSTKESLARDGDHGTVKKAWILAALQADPEGARAFVSYALAQLEREPAERAREKEELAAIGRREWMEKQPATAKQQSLLTRLGYSKEPANRWEASRLIEQLKDW